MNKPMLDTCKQTSGKIGGCFQLAAERMNNISVCCMHTLREAQYHLCVLFHIAYWKAPQFMRYNLLVLLAPLFFDIVLACCFRQASPRSFSHLTNLVCDLIHDEGSVPWSLPLLQFMFLTPIFERHFPVKRGWNWQVQSEWNGQFSHP